ncbi:MAG TPA: BrnA antitoxin family protein [Gemmatimonadales bacterium]|nr:BrnA antitoxin family protein [Gemmatimonadales bacterium]
MSAKRTKKPSASPDRPLRGRADLARLRRATERVIKATSPPELADLPPDFWTQAHVVWPVAKQAISLRVDRDVLEWFRGQGPRYQSRMNAVLRAYMTQARRRRRSRSGAA